jgi:hypothetical protein
MKTPFIKKILPTIAFSCACLPFQLIGLEEANQPNGLNFPAHKFNWYLSSDKEQEEAIEKALISLAFEKIFNLQISFDNFLDDKFKSLSNFHSKKFIESAWQTGRSREKAFIILASIKALDAWADGESFNKLFASSSSYSDYDQPIIGTLKYIYFTYPYTLAFPYQGDWYFVSKEEIKSITDTLKINSKTIDSKSDAFTEAFTFEPKESKASINALYALLNESGQLILKKALVAFNKIANLNGDLLSVYFTYLLKSDLSESLQESIGKIEKQYKVISHYVKRSGVIEEVEKN